MARRSAGLVEVQPADEAEAVPQRPGDETGPGRGADQREARELQADGAGRRALADQDVEAAVLHGRVEHLLDGSVQAVDLVDEQHVAVLQVGEQRGQVAGPGQDGAGGDAEPGAHLGGHDPGQ